MREEIRKAAWLMLCESSAHEAVAEAVRTDAGWRGSERTALAALSKWTAPGSRALPAYVAAIIVRVCVPLGARDRLSPIFAREGFAAAQSMDDLRAPMAKVRQRRSKEKQA